jgi:hypothetical protein
VRQGHQQVLEADGVVPARPSVVERALDRFERFGGKGNR